MRMLNLDWRTPKVYLTIAPRGAVFVFMPFTKVAPLGEDVSKGIIRGKHEENISLSK